MLSLLKASDIVRIGLTCTQTFFLVGKNATKKLCRFVKTDSIKTAISTLLAIEGEPCFVEDIRMADLDGLKVWTNQGIKQLPPAKVRCFLARYNRLIKDGCFSQCNCEDEPWAHFCIHKIAEHLSSVKEKVSAILQFAKNKTQRILDNVKSQLTDRNLNWSVFEEDGDYFFKVQNFGHLIVTETAELLVVSQSTDNKEYGVGSISDALDLLKPPKSCLPFYFITSDDGLCEKAENL
jgi:hypothetical protein